MPQTIEMSKTEEQHVLFSICEQKQHDLIVCTEIFYWFVIFIEKPIETLAISIPGNK